MLKIKTGSAFVFDGRECVVIETRIDEDYHSALLPNGTWQPAGEKFQATIIVRDKKQWEAENADPGLPTP